MTEPMIVKKDIETARKVMHERLTRQLESYLHICAKCGLCNDTCHYSLSIPGDPKLVPAYKADVLRKIWKRERDWLGAAVPWFVGAEDLDEKWLDEAADSVFGSCTLCRRCVVNCPLGVDTALIVATARAMLTAVGRIPKGLKETIIAHNEVGNNMGIPTEDAVDTLQWMEEEMQAEPGFEKATIPIDKEKADFLYTMNPREIKYFPLSIKAAAKIFNYVGADWTVDKLHWDVTNYALFSQDAALARKFAGWIEDAAVQRGVKELIMGECGHGFRAMRWEAANWLGHELAVPVVSLVELMWRWIQEGKIKLDPEKNGDKVYTYHDSCNLTRTGGIVDEPRFIIAKTVKNFVEMEPHGVNNYCCGGGGGAMAMTEYGKLRLKAGKIKADQIKATGASVILTACHNCVDALRDLNKEYKLGVTVLNICEVVADALIIPGK